MTTFAPKHGLRIVDLSFSDGKLVVALSDGRVLKLPLEWYPRLAQADDSQRANWRLLGEGEGVHWTELDEDLSLAGFLAGRPAAGSAEYQSRYRPLEYVALESDLAEQFVTDHQVNEALREYLRFKRD